MKRILVLLSFVPSFFYLGNAIARENNVDQQMGCKDTKLNKYPAQLYAIGRSIAISVVVGYENADLICGFQGPCTGIRFGNQILPEGSAHLIRGPNGQLLGFSFKSALGVYTFRCQ